MPFKDMQSEHSRRSLSQATGDTFGIGDICASLYAKGKSPDDNDQLKITVTGSESSDAKSFRIRFGIALGPQALIGLSHSFVDFRGVDDR